MHFTAQIQCFLGIPRTAYLFAESDSYSFKLPLTSGQVRGEMGESPLFAGLSNPDEVIKTQASGTHRGAIRSRLCD